MKNLLGRAMIGIGIVIGGIHFSLAPSWLGIKVNETPEWAKALIGDTLSRFTTLHGLVGIVLMLSFMGFGIFLLNKD